LKKKNVFFSTLLASDGDNDLRCKKIFHNATRKLKFKVFCRSARTAPRGLAENIRINTKYMWSRIRR